MKSVDHYDLKICRSYFYPCTARSRLFLVAERHRDIMALRSRGNEHAREQFSPARRRQELRTESGRKKISRYSVERIDDCLHRVIRRHQTSRSSSGIVYLALDPVGGHLAQSGWARHPRLCHNNNVNLSPRVYPLASFPSPLSLSLSSPISGEPTSRLHHRRQFAGHTKRVDNLKGKSSLLTQEGHGTANARASSRSVKYNASRWTSTALPGTVFRSVGRARHYHMDPHGLLRDPRPSALHLTFSRVPCPAATPPIQPAVCPSLNSRMLLGFRLVGDPDHVRVSSKQSHKKNRHSS